MTEHQRTDWDHVIGLAVAIGYAAEQKGRAWAEFENDNAVGWQAIVDDKLAELRHIADMHVAYESKGY